MFKLGTKIPGPFGTAIRVALWNLAATLFVGVVFATFTSKLSNSIFNDIFTGLLVVLTFPANQIGYLVGSRVNFFLIPFLNSLIWGLVAFVVHWAKNFDASLSAQSLDQESLAAEKFNGPPCVSCGAPTNPTSEVCPKCGWTQPR